MRLAIRGLWLARCFVTFGVRVVDRNPVYAWRGSHSTSSKALWLAYWHWNQLSGQSLDWNLVCGSVFPGLPSVAHNTLRGVSGICRYPEHSNRAYTGFLCSSLLLPSVLSLMRKWY